MRDDPSPRIKKQTGRSNGDEALAELRNILIGPEQNEIQQLWQRVENVELQPEDIGRVLPEAINLRRKDKRLIHSLQPSVEEAIKISVEKNPKTLVNALFPVMGPAIRKAIASTFAAMIQSMNQTLEHSLSVRGLKWRLEAARTGKSFAEIVLLHSLTYRVEQVFLIHKSDGLLLQHVQASSIQAQDADMVSGMLTAIQDFIRDSFHVDEEVNSMQVGSLNVWIEQGPHAYLAAVIRGTAPQDLRIILQETLERIHQWKAEDLESFQGDNSPFESIRPLLEECLQVQYKSTKRTTSRGLIFILTVAALLLGWWGFLTFRTNRQWQHYLEKLKSEPGIVITETDKNDGIFYVSGLRDPLATNPDAILKQSEINPQKVRTSWNPYQALEPAFILTRAQKILQPPPDVTLRFENGILSASGSASQEWITESRLLARSVSGIQQYDDRLVQPAGLKELEALKLKIEGTVVTFLRNEAVLSPGQEEKLSVLTSQFSDLRQTARELNKTFRVQITGRADSEGSEEHNLHLSSARAEEIIRLLLPSGLEHSFFKPVGIGSKNPLRPEESEEQREYNRSVSFQIEFAD